MNCHTILSIKVLQQFWKPIIFTLNRNIHFYQNGSTFNCMLVKSNKQYFHLIYKQNIAPCYPNLFFRSYAKGKDIKKGKGKKVVTVNREQLSEILDIDLFEKQMQESIDTLKEEFVKNLSLRSSTGSIETLKVSLDGKEYELQELAQIIRKNPKTIVINMATFPQAIQTALKSIQSSGMNLNPQQDGTTLYVPVPAVTREHRENLSKNAKKLFLTFRDKVKGVQNKYIKAIKKDDTLSSDVQYDAQLQLNMIGDKYVSQGEKILEFKQNELLGGKT